MPCVTLIFLKYKVADTEEKNEKSPVREHPVDGPVPMHIWAALIRFSGLWRRRRRGRGRR